MKIYKHILTTLVAVIGLGLTSCKEKASEPTIPAIQVGTGTNLSEITVAIQGEQRLLLSGGNGKYTVQIGNTALASAKIEDTTLILSGLVEGETYLIIRSGSQSQRVKIMVKPPSTKFSQPTIELTPKQVSSSITLSGGGKDVTLTPDDPLKCISYRWNASNNALEITAIHEGVAKLTAKAPGQPDQTLEIRVASTEKPTATGVYLTNNNTPYKVLNNLLTYRSKATGVTTISAKATPYGNHARISVPRFTTPTLGEWIELDLSFDQVDKFKSGKYRLLVESVGERTSLLGEGFRIIVPTP